MTENEPFACTDEYAIIKKHFREEGLIQVPLATDDGTPACEVIRLHNPIERVEIHWTGTKFGAPPLVPHPNLFSSNHTFLHGVRTVASPMADGQASSAAVAYREALLASQDSGNNLAVQLTGEEEKLPHMWQMTGLYVYAVGVPMGLGSAITAGKMPFDSIAVVDTVIPAENFKQGIYEEEFVFLNPLPA